MQATLNVVRRGNDHVVFQINAPAVAAALTRKANAMGTDELSALDISEAMCDRFCDAFAGKPVLNFSFARNQSKWFVKAELHVKPAKPSRKPAARAAAKACAHQHPKGEVDTMDTTVKGTHSCPQCMGTGRYVIGLENGAPKFGTGICYRCKGKGRTTEIDRRRNLKYWEHAAAKAMGMDIANAEKVAS